MDWTSAGGFSKQGNEFSGDIKLRELLACLLISQNNSVSAA
jgi:hypothetical protein